MRGKTVAKEYSLAIFPKSLESYKRSLFWWEGQPQGKEKAAAEGGESRTKEWKL